MLAGMFTDRRAKLLITAALLAMAMAAAGCSTKQGKLDGDAIATGSTAPAGSGQTKGDGGSYIKTRELAQAWQAHPGDETIGLSYAEGLTKLGQQDAAFDVLKAISVAHPTDATVQAKIGKQLLAANRPGEAATVLERAAAANPSDWKTLSALGSAYDQSGRYELARSQYNKALALKPGALSVQNNMGMSFALQGKLPEAEKVLRMAQAQPGSAAEPRIRQNLALVVGLEGRFDEAKQIASADLPPDQVEANLAYLQQMLSKPNTWAQLTNPPATSATAN